jgi:lysophospholipase L1-like esterase
MTYSEIHIWGDSLARGIVFNETKQRYAISSVRYSALLEERFGLPVHNHSLMGMTAVDGLAAFSQSPDPASNALCAIEYGGNDCDLDWAHVAEYPEDHIQAKVPLPLYHKTLLSWVDAVRERGMEPLLVTPVPLHSERYFRWVSRGLDGDSILRALHGDVHSIYRWQERYTLAMRNVAVKTGCPLLDMRDVFLSQSDYPACMCVDGIHPNEAGHQLIADAVLEAAQQNPRMPQRSGVALETDIVDVTAVVAAPSGVPVG